MELEQNIILEIQNSTTTFLKWLLCISSQPKKENIEKRSSYIFQGGRCEVSSNGDPQFSIDIYIYQLFLYKI